ncbi:hypothetical protein EJ04DRAFT_341877 [Polyplosphaeria fusca]|uniref:Uncharacterized protein n=1 Tax=Polyplosphaeria fusca TaxID=682080 RepID=A0A9P4QWH1_9PLEO|nr:hypothetical protein EJ04DRAFT_341877 [Polyplosphaeria fusca]
MAWDDRRWMDGLGVAEMQACKPPLPSSQWAPPVSLRPPRGIQGGGRGGRRPQALNEQAAAHPRRPPVQTRGPSVGNFLRSTAVCRSCQQSCVPTPLSTTVHYRPLPGGNPCTALAGRPSHQVPLNTLWDRPQRCLPVVISSPAWKKSNHPPYSQLLLDTNYPGPFCWSPQRRRRRRRRRRRTGPGQPLRPSECSATDLVLRNPPCAPAAPPPSNRPLCPIRRPQGRRF